MEALKNLFKKEKKREAVNPGETEKILETREIENKRLLLGYKDTVILLHLKDDGDAVFKPKSKERSLRSEVKEGTYFKRGRAAYLVDRFLNLNLVPPTTIRELDGEIGSVQEYIRHTPSLFELSVKNREKAVKKQKERLLALWLFDIIIWSSDRHMGNLLIGDNVHAIDNDLSFGADGLRYLRPYYDTPIPPNIIANLERFTSSHIKKQILHNMLSKLIPPQEASACISRIERVTRLVKKGVIAQRERGILETFS